MGRCLVGDANPRHAARNRLGWLSRCTRKRVLHAHSPQTQRDPTRHVRVVALLGLILSWEMEASKDYRYGARDRSGTVQLVLPVLGLLR